MSEGAKTNERAEDHLPEKPTEEQAIQQYRNLLKNEDPSPEFKNFSEGMKLALSTPKKGVRQTKKRTRT